MRILMTIPHFYRAKSDAAHGSEKADASARLRVLHRCLTSLHSTFGRGQTYMASSNLRSNTNLTSGIDVVVCTTGDAHLLDRLPPGLFRHHSTDAQPRFLGYECHAVLAEALGTYDYYCFMEDDLLITDALFFWKAAWFVGAVGAEAVLQPHRFELSDDPPIRKLYIDGPLVDPSISARYQDVSVQPNLRGYAMGRELAFERTGNPHSGCFFLQQQQMRLWREQPYFLDRSDGFWGPLESAATLGLMRTFRVYKPTRENAGFFELEHMDRRYLGSRVQFPTDFYLAEA